MRNPTLACGLVSVLFLFTGCGDGPAGPSSEAAFSSASSSDKSGKSGQSGKSGKSGKSERNLIVELKGTAEGEFREIDGTEMDCFDVDLFDVASGELIGTGTDCLDLNSIAGGDPAAGEAFAISNTTFFNFSDGSIKSRNRTTISPVIEGSPEMTHSTSDVPTVNNILEGTGEFEEVEGIARLAGAVNMSLFFSDNIITFNCIFVLSLDDD